MKPEIKELLGKARKAYENLTSTEWAEDIRNWPEINNWFSASEIEYIAALSPDKMIALLEYVQGLEFSNKLLTIQLEAELKQQQDSSND